MAQQGASEGAGTQGFGFGLRGRVRALEGKAFVATCSFRQLRAQRSSVCTTLMRALAGESHAITDTPCAVAL